VPVFADESVLRRPAYCWNKESEKAAGERLGEVKPEELEKMSAFRDFIEAWTWTTSAPPTRQVTAVNRLAERRPNRRLITSSEAVHRGILPLGVKVPADPLMNPLWAGWWEEPRRPLLDIATSRCYSRPTSEYEAAVNRTSRP
jgi:hypothetical protein